MKCTIIKSREHLRIYLTFAIRHIIIISRAIEYDDPLTAGNVVTAKVKKLLNEDLERVYLIAIYNSRVENFKSVFLIDNILERIEESENKLQDGKLTLYFFTLDQDNSILKNHNKKDIQKYHQSYVAFHIRMKNYLAGPSILCERSLKCQFLA